MRSDFGNKEVFQKNLLRYIEKSGKTRSDIFCALGIKEVTFNSWCRGEYYPRIDKIEMLADYFGCTKSDLIERKSEERAELAKTIKTIDTETKKSLLDFVANCSDKEAEMLMSFVKVMKGEN